MKKSLKAFILAILLIFSTIGMTVSPLLEGSAYAKSYPGSVYEKKQSIEGVVLSQPAFSFILVFLGISVAASATFRLINAKLDFNKKQCSKKLTLGWVICPILSGISDVSQKIYGDLIAPSLEVNAELVSSSASDGSGPSGTYAGWNIFRLFANILIAIFILVVILSQVTGFGIDNYGIKKTLPKIIVSVLLINLSFLICQVVVDVSNIFGNGTINLLFSIAESINADVTVPNLSGTEKGITLASTGLSAAALVGAGYLTATGTFAAIPILTAIASGLISFIVGIFTLFLLLAVRKAAIVILIVVSPIAIVLNILPNTKNIYDKWFNALKAMLLLYPMCGLVMGGSNLAQQILLSAIPRGELNDNTHFMLDLTAMIVAAVPMFFIPTLTRNAFVALGNIGNRITGVTRRFSRSASGAVTRSAAFRALGERATEAQVSRGLAKYNNAYQGYLDKAEKKYRKKHGIAPGAKLTEEQQKEMETEAAAEANGRMGRRRQMIYAERLRTQEDIEKKKAGDQGYISAVGKAGMSQYMANIASQSSTNAEDAVNAVNQYGVEYRKDDDGNILTMDASGNWVGKNKANQKISYTSDQAKNFKKAGTYADAKLQSSNIARFEEAGRMGGYVDATTATAAANAAAVSGLTASQDALRTKIYSGSEAAIRAAGIRSDAEMEKTVKASEAMATMSNAQMREYVKNSGRQSTYTTKDNINAVNQFGQNYQVDRGGSGLSFIDDGAGGLMGFDADGNKHTVKKTGSGWTYTDATGNKTSLTNAEYSKRFETVSYGEAKLQGNDVARGADYGRTASYANPAMADIASGASTLSGLRQGNDQVADTILSGNEKVLKLEHDKSQSARNALQGSANAGVQVVSVARAQSLAEQRNLTAELGEYNEINKSKGKTQLETELTAAASAGANASSARIISAYQSLVAQGGTEEILKGLRAIPGANLQATDQNVLQGMFSTIAADNTNIVAQRYAKEQLKRLQAGGTAAVQDFDTFTRVSLDAEMTKKYGEAGLAKLSADILKDINKNPTSYSIAGSKLFGADSIREAVRTAQPGEFSTEIATLINNYTDSSTCIDILSKFNAADVKMNPELFRTLVTKSGQTFAQLTAPTGALYGMMAGLNDPNNAAIRTSGQRIITDFFANGHF